MCGIFGLVGQNLTNSAIEDVLLNLDHRGPDGRGVFTDASAQVTLAHTRLTIIDLVTGAQPLYSQDGNIVLVCNGEIYGFERIRSSLQAKGHRFTTKSDSEVIIYLYEEYGLDCFEHLRGEFAFLLYDKSKRLLVAGRDRFGIKPLYFSKHANSFVFASEMKAIFASGIVEPQINIAGLDPLLNLDPANVQFPFLGIEQVPPASFLTVDVSTLESRITRYWSSEIPPETAEAVPKPYGKAPEACAESVLQELNEAVQLRLRADVPVGLYLSGGIDSAFVGALMARNLKSKLHSFSISFAGSEKNEQKHTRQAAAFLGTAHHELVVTREMLWDNLEKTLWFTELPFASLAPVGKFILSEEARKYVKVVLNGQGADEVFLGYRSFFQSAVVEGRNSSHSPNFNTRLRRLKLANLPSELVQKLSLSLFHKSQRSRLAKARQSALAGRTARRPVVNIIQEDRIAEMPMDILGFLGDRVEMAHSLEVRVPFLDHKLYDTARFIPVDFKLREGVEKAVLRDAARDILPDDIRTRRKLGFMLTSDKIDFFGADRKLTAKFRPYLTREAFERAQIFSWRAYQVVSILARLPLSKRVGILRRVRRNANKVVMYMLQAQMLHAMYVTNRRSPRQAKHRLPRTAEQPERLSKVR
jgi:asparagine synthase (glutamine-hydrolysing)